MSAVTVAVVTTAPCRHSYAQAEPDPNGSWQGRAVSLLRQQLIAFERAPKLASGGSSVQLVVLGEFNCSLEQPLLCGRVLMQYPCHRAFDREGRATVLFAGDEVLDSHFIAML